MSTRSVAASFNEPSAHVNRHAALGTTAPHDEWRSLSVERARNLGAGAAAHQPVVETRKLPLVGGGIELRQEFGDRQAQYAVAEKLEPLVIAPLATLALTHAGVGQGALQQLTILEMMADARF